MEDIYIYIYVIAANVGAATQRRCRVLVPEFMYHDILERGCPEPSQDYSCGDLQLLLASFHFNV